jgi:hypothetical protein
METRESENIEHIEFEDYTIDIDKDDIGADTDNIDYEFNNNIIKKNNDDIIINNVSENNIISEKNNKNIKLLCKNVCLFTNARDEKHIREWAAHHLLIGFTKIIIFDHKSKIPLTKIFENFDKRVKIINVSYLKNPIKMKLMNVARNIAVSLNMDWMIYLDADEFIILNKKFIGIKHFLSRYYPAHSIGVNWIMFGSNYLKNDPDGIILDNYTKSDLKLHPHVKTFVRPKYIKFADNPHFYNMIPNSIYVGVNKKILKLPYHSNHVNINFYNSPAYIAHYIYQSEETFINRKIRLPADDTGIKRNHDETNVGHIHNNHNLGENTQPKLYYAENIKLFLKKYGYDY